MDHREDDPPLLSSTSSGALFQRLERDAHGAAHHAPDPDSPHAGYRPETVESAMQIRDQSLECIAKMEDVLRSLRNLICQMFPPVRPHQSGAPLPAQNRDHPDAIPALLPDGGGGGGGESPASRPGSQQAMSPWLSPFPGPGFGLPAQPQTTCCRLGAGWPGVHSPHCDWSLCQRQRQALPVPAMPVHPGDCCGFDCIFCDELQLQWTPQRTRAREQQQQPLGGSWTHVEAPVPPPRPPPPPPPPHASDAAPSTPRLLPSPAAPSRRSHRGGGMPPPMAWTGSAQPTPLRLPEPVACGPAPASAPHATVVPARNRPLALGDASGPRHGHMPDF